MIKKVGSSEFAATISSGTVLVDCYTNTCIPCKLYTRELESIVFDLPFLEVIRVCGEESPDIFRQYQVQAVPTTLIFQDGELVTQYAGVKNADDVKQLTSDYLYGNGD